MSQLLSLLLRSAALATILAALSAKAESPPVALKTALDAYVQGQDPAYGFELVKTLPHKGFTAYILKMRSQTWRSKEEVDRVLWEHDIKIIVPDTLLTETGLLFIGGGANGRESPNTVMKELAQVALATGSVVSELGQVPNQPLRFLDDPEKEDRTEDSLVAYTWDKFLQGGDARWLARFPMTKSAVRAMDTISSFCGSNVVERVHVKRYVVAGGSKRGWTTWMTAAVDKRVVGIVPIVIDMLNVRPSFQHHFQAYGFFAPAVGDYVSQGIMDWQDTERYGKLLELVEPFEYRERFTMPKLMLNAAGDQFFLPDSSQFYFDQLPGEKYLRYVPNGDHSLRETDAYETLLAYYAMLLTDAERPKFSWKSAEEGHLHVIAEDKPSEAKLWQAHNSKTRDFRKDTIGAGWSATVLKPDEQGNYVARVAKPDKGWTAMFIELSYPTPAKVALKVTTSVEVIPKALPFPPFEPKRGGPKS